MKQELAWGTAAAMALVAAVGISSQSGSKPETSSSAEKKNRTVVSTSKTAKGGSADGALPHCADIIPLLGNFFLREPITGPDGCYPESRPLTPLNSSYQTRFIIATFPDPLHTHFSLLFDRFVEALQQGAQDEGYQYDSSWMPWETEEEPALTHLDDQDKVDERKEKREEQPGIILFRDAGPAAYHRALVVFVVGEESTRGIHRRQFENSVAWIGALRPATDTHESVAILGPTFSGSFPSLNELLAKTGITGARPSNGLAIFSGSASSSQDAAHFVNNTAGVQFRSFLQDDETALKWLCQYFGEKTKETLKRVAILSEEETAYGYAGHSGDACPGALKTYYPRDISTLRAAYQSQSMFSSSSSDQSQDTSQRKSLPTDLADPAGQQHDTVRTYAGNQTPLSQEAQLLGIVDVLRAHQANYVILRSSNTLDPLFLANFLRVNYPEARVIIVNSDLLFQRGKDALALRGVMTLSTYPLFSWAREWTALPFSNVHSHRVFPENGTQGTYIASRMLLQTLARANQQMQSLDCVFADQEPFAPALRCQIRTGEKTRTGLDSTIDPVIYSTLPDYAPPLWMEQTACAPTGCRPATWLSVITRNGTWPIAALNKYSLEAGSPGTDLPAADVPRIWPRTPRSTKVLLVVLCCLAVFQFLCCRFASFTAKPAFLAHFATPGLRHTGLVLIGSYLIALMALMMGWGHGIFAAAPGPPPASLPVWFALAFVWLVSGAANAVNILAVRKLNADAESQSNLRLRMAICIVLFAALTAAFFFAWVWPIESVLLLATRAFVYWRSMNLLSGVSPVVPFLSLTAGLYIWVWYALHGLALFGLDRPCLPPLETLGVKIKAPQGGNHRDQDELKLSMFSQQKVANVAEPIAKPLAWDNVKMIAILFALLATIMFGLGWGVPIRNLGTIQATTYSRIFCLALCFYCALLFSDAWQVWRTWSSARQLLVFLDRLALRRTLSALQGFSWGTVWRMSGNVLDVRYKLLSRQLECLNHLHNSLRLFTKPRDTEERAAYAGIETCQRAVYLTREEGLRFAQWYSGNYCKREAGDLQKFQDFQRQIAETTGVVLSQLVVPANRAEEHSLIQVDPQASRDEDRKGLPRSENELIRNAEELVCLTYLGFVQNLLGRIRTIVLGGIYLFVALTIAVASYPFDPRTLLSGILLLVFFGFGGIVVFAYADMHRDTTLSHITNTEPGKLGSEFWLKVVGYGAAPLLGLMTQVFPEWAGFLFSWLQPGLSSLK